jgi:hypothetical protein
VAVKGYDSLINQLNKMMQTDRIMVASLNTVLASQKKRIFQSGEDANGSKIGTYSTDPISISRKNQSRQTGKTYFKEGYRQYKGLTGKGNSFVNLRNTDQMMMDYGVHVLGKNEYGLGFNNQFNYDKSEWNEERYSKEIFAESNEEGALFQRVFEYELNKIE